MKLENIKFNFVSKHILFDLKTFFIFIQQKYVEIVVFRV